MSLEVGIPPNSILNFGVWVLIKKIRIRISSLGVTLELRTTKLNKYYVTSYNYMASHETWQDKDII